MANTLDISLKDDGFDSVTKRYGFSRDPVTGDVAFDETQAYKVLGAALCREQEYWADGTLGSKVHQLKSLTSKTPSQAEAAVSHAQQPLVDAGLIEEPTVSAAARRDASANRLVTKIRWTTPGGASGQQAVLV